MLNRLQRLIDSYHNANAAGRLLVILGRCLLLGSVFVAGCTYYGFLLG